MGTPAPLPLFLAAGSRESGALCAGTVAAAISSPFACGWGDSAPTFPAGSLQPCQADGPAGIFWREVRLTDSEDEMVWKMRARGSPWDKVTEALIERRRQFITSWNAARTATLEAEAPATQRERMCCGDLFSTREGYRLCTKHRGKG